MASREYLEAVLRKVKGNLSPEEFSVIHHSALSSAGGRRKANPENTGPTLLEKIALEEIRPAKLREEGDDEIRQAWNRVNQWYASAKEKGTTTEPYVNAAIFLMEEMQKRRFAFDEKLPIVREAMELKKTSNLFKLDRAFHRLPREIPMVTKFVQVVGSAAEGKRDPKDVDVVIRADQCPTSPDHVHLNLDSPWVAIRRHFDKEKLGGVHYIPNAQGSFTDHMPLYDLVLRRRPELEREIIIQKAGKPALGINGPKTARVLFVGGATTPEQVAADNPLIGDDAETFDRLFLSPVGLTRADVQILNAVPEVLTDSQGNPREPEFSDVEEWKSWVYGEVEAADPELVVALGPIAAESINGLADLILPAPAMVKHFGEGNLKASLDQFRLALVESGITKADKTEEPAPVVESPESFAPDALLAASMLSGQTADASDPSMALALALLGVPVATPSGIDEFTPEMEMHFEERTKRHISGVKENLIKFAGWNGLTEEILAKTGEKHDASKFTAPERVPYIWNSHMHKMRKADSAYNLPASINPAVKQATLLHIKANEHHPEFWGSPDEMRDIDIAEMVSDWAAMANELQSPGGARAWADQNVGKRWVFNELRKQRVYDAIAHLEKASGATGEEGGGETRGENSAKQWEDSFIDLLPKKSNKGRFVYHHHYVGLTEEESKLDEDALLNLGPGRPSVHGDLRLEADDGLWGWTAFLGEAKDIRAAGGDRIQNLPAGDAIQTWPKLQQPMPWLDVASHAPMVVPPGGPGNPNPETWAKFFRYDSGEYDVTFVKQHLVEIFLHGSKLKGRYLVEFAPVGENRVWIITRPESQVPYLEDNKLAREVTDQKEKGRKWLYIVHEGKPFVVDLSKVTVSDDMVQQGSEVLAESKPETPAQKCSVSKLDQEKQLIYGVVLEPTIKETGEKDGRPDTQGDMMRASEIERTAHDYLKNSRVVGANHAALASANVVESFIAPTTFKWPDSEQVVKQGSWVLVVHVTNPKEWERVRAGEFNAFSVGGFGERTAI